MKKRLEQGVILLGTFLVAFMGSALNPAIPSIAGEFQAGVSQSGWIVTAYMVTCTALPVPFGRWAEQTDPKKILAGGLGIFTAASVGGIFISSMGLLLGVRALQGIGTAMIYSTGMWVLIKGVGENLRAKLLGYSSAAMYLGLASGPAAGGILNQYLGWRTIFAAAAVISAVAFSGSLMVLKHGSTEKPGFPAPGKTSPSGSSLILYAAAAASFTAGLQLISAGWWGWIAVVAGLILIVLYAAREKRAERPLLPLKQLRRRSALGIHCISSMISCGVNFVINYLLSLYLQIGMGFSPQKAGLLLILSPAVQAVTSVGVGKVMMRTGVSVRILAAVGILGSGGAALWFSRINGQWSMWAICAGLGAAGFFSALFTAPNTMEIMSAAGKERMNLASALISTVRSLGNSIGVASASLASSFLLGQARLSEADPEMLTEVLKLVFSFWAVLCILGFIMELRKKV